MREAWHPAVTLASAELYNPATGTFTTTGSLNTARSTHTATLLNNGMVLIAGGTDSSSGTLSQCGAVQSRHRDLHPHRQPEHRALRAHGDAAEQRHGADGGRLWTHGDATLASAELYNPATGTFTPTGSLNTARYSHTATLLNNGMVLMAGGA